MKTLLFVFMLAAGLMACGDNVGPDPAPPDAGEVTPDAAPAPPDASPPDATPPCLIEHRWAAVSDDDPPYASVSPAGRLTRNVFGGGLGIDDGYIDTGEVLRIDFAAPARVVEYRSAWAEDGPDDFAQPGEHDYVIETGGEVLTRRSLGVDNLITVDAADVTAMEIRPVNGDRLALGYLQFDRCNTAPPTPE